MRSFIQFNAARSCTPQPTDFLLLGQLSKELLGMSGYFQPNPLKERYRLPEFLPRLFYLVLLYQNECLAYARVSKRRCVPHFREKGDRLVKSRRCDHLCFGRLQGFLCTFAEPFPVPRLPGTRDPYC